jgi:uncharacterized spore protein YtfJ
MGATNILHQMSESLGSTATVKSVFGEPIQVGDKTVVPVARVGYGFGGGFGAAPKRLAKGEGEKSEGGGGGGGVLATPAGALEITADSTRFVLFTDFRLLAAAFGVGALFGSVILSRRRRG